MSQYNSIQYCAIQYNTLYSKRGKRASKVYVHYTASLFITVLAAHGKRILTNDCGRLPYPSRTVYNCSLLKHVYSNNIITINGRIAQYNLLCVFTIAIAMTHSLSSALSVHVHT